MEREWGLPGGCIYQTDMTPDQLFSLRPVPGWSGYRTPIRGLYLLVRQQRASRRRRHRRSGAERGDGGPRRPPDAQRLDPLDGEGPARTSVGQSSGSVAFTPGGTAESANLFGWDRVGPSDGGGPQARIGAGTGDGRGCGRVRRLRRADVRAELQGNLRAMRVHPGLLRPLKSTPAGILDK